MADSSSGLQLAAAVGAYLLEGQIHCTLRKGGRYRMRCGPACSAYRDCCGLKHALERRRPFSRLYSAALAACRLCPRNGFKGVVDKSRLAPAQEAHSSLSEASAADSEAPRRQLAAAMASAA